MSHKGSILCLPSGIHGWDASDPAGVATADFQRAIDEAEGIDILLVGTGRGLVPLPRALKEALRAAGLNADPMSTGAAVRTYNVLLAEDRAVAAALIAVE